jgi:hypothetical protein
MSKNKNVDLQKHTLNLRAGDYEKMQQLLPELGAGPAIRQLVSNFIDKYIPPTKD